MPTIVIGGHKRSMFVDSPADSLICVACARVSRDPEQTLCCGRLYCVSCQVFNKALGRTACPGCGESDFSTFPDTRSAGEIDALKVKCDSCDWIGQLGSVEEHTQRFHAPVPCKYAEMGCKEKLAKEDLQEHEDNDILHLNTALDTIIELNKQVKELQGRLEEAPGPRTKAVFKFQCLVGRMSSRRPKPANYNNLYSPPIYSSSKGYRMCLNVKADGEGKGSGTHISVFVFLMKGDNDDSLSWPFVGTVTVELLNQLEDKNHHKTVIQFSSDNKASERVIVDENVSQIEVIRAAVSGRKREMSQSGLGTEKFIRFEDIEHDPEKNCSYYEDDTLFFRVSVKVPSHKPWLEHINKDVHTRY